MKTKKGNPLVLIFVALGIALIPFVFSGFWYLSPDTFKIGLGSKRISETGSIQPNIEDHYGYSPHILPSDSYYPTLQLVTYSVSSFSNVDPMYILAGISILLYLGCIALVYLVLSKIFPDKSGLIIIATFFAVTSTVLLRSLVLTPQNLVGYLLIFLILLFVFDLYNKTSIKALASVLFFSFALLVFHQLSFIVFMPALLIIFFLQRKLRVLGIIGLCLGIFTPFILSFYYTGNPFNFSLFFQYLQGLFYAEPVELLNSLSLTNEIAVFGYVFTIFGFWGLLVLLKSKNIAVKKIVFSLFIVFFLLGNLSFFGFVHLPDRFLAYVWIPLVLTIPFSLSRFYQLVISLGYKSYCRLLAYVLLCALIISGLSFIYDDYVFFSKPLQLTTNDTSAINYLRELEDEDRGTILTSLKGDSKNNIYLSYFLNTPISYYLSESITLIPTIDTEETTNDFILELFPSLQRSVPENEAIVLDNRYHLWLMLNFPSSDSARGLYSEYDIRYIYLKKNSKEERNVSKSQELEKVFENEEVVIYER